MKVAISQSNYIPWKGYFDLISKVDVFVIYDEVQYTKNDWRNRNLIKTKDGLQWLTIPVRQLHLGQRIDETVVTDKSWWKKHLNAFKTNYAKAPYFKEYEGRLGEIYAEAGQMKLLSEINQFILLEICSWLGINTKIIRSTDLSLAGDRNERLIQAVLLCGGTTYLSGPAAKVYLDAKAFTKQAIAIEWMEYTAYPEYPQTGDTFEHGVSILDAIFQIGIRCTEFMKFK